MPVYVHSPSRSLLLPESIAAQAASVTARSRWIAYRGERLLALPHDLETARSLGDLVPGPILHYYDWPGRHEPFEKQRITADFFTRHDRCFCFNEIGTGKTMSALWAADYMKRVGALRGAVPPRCRPFSSSGATKSGNRSRGDTPTGLCTATAPVGSECWSSRSTSTC